MNQPSSWICAALGGLAAVSAFADGPLSLDPAAPAPPPTIARAWPAAPVSPVVCLWRDDKQAAFSLTIDDNHVEDHPFWLQAARDYGWKWTWFIIAGKVGSPGPWGAWSDWQAIADAGHDVQSHSVQHLNPKQTEPLSIEQEYAESQRLIDEHLPGARCLTLAYPNGLQPPNDPLLAARFYLACRGVRGLPNLPGQTNYRDVQSVSAAAGFLEPASHWASWAGVLDPAQPKKFGAWYCCHFHGLTDDLKRQVTVMLARLKEQEAEVWVGTFREIAQYGQERDSAQLTAEQRADGALVIRLTDALDDAVFDAPLTLKVRLPENWPAARATQDGKPLAVAKVENLGAAFALVAAVPDRGLIVLEQSTTP